MQASYTTEAQTRHATLEAFRTFATDADFLNRHQLKAAWVAVFGSRPHKAGGLVL